MTFKEIFEKWENSAEGKKAAEKSRFSHILKEKEEGLKQTEKKINKSYKTGRSSLGKLKAMKPQASIDLHGNTIEETRLLLDDFLNQSVKKRVHKVAIIFGRGLHSPDGIPILKDIVKEILEQSPLVRFYNHPLPVDGGTGVYWVILQRA
jgi:DNA-nicking Smr family endonuclease